MVVVLNKVTGCQNRGVRTLLTDYILNTLGGSNLTVEAGTREVNILIRGGVAQSLVLHLGSKLLRAVRLSLHRNTLHHVLTSPQVLNRQLGVALLLSNQVNLVTHLVTRDTGEVVARLVVVQQRARLDGQLSIQGAILGNGEVLTLLKTERRTISGQKATIGNALRSGNINCYVAVLLTPFLRETRTLHVNGAALGGVQQLSLSVVQNLKRRGSLLNRLSSRNIRSLRTIRTIKVQRLGSEQGTAALGSLTHDGSDKLIATLVAVIAPHLDGVLLRRIQGVSGNLNVTVEEPMLVLGRILGVVVLDDVANSQDGGVRALLTHNNLNTLRGVNITLKTPTREVQNLIVTGILQSVVAPMRSELIRSSNRILADAMIRQGTSNSRRRSIRNNILSNRRRHRQNHRASQRQCTATPCCTEEGRSLEIRKSGHNHSLSVEPIAPMQFLKGGEESSSNLRQPNEKWSNIPVDLGDTLTLAKG